MIREVILDTGPLVARYLCEYPLGSGRFFAAPCQTDAIGFVYRRDWFTDPAEQEAFAARYGRPLAAPDTWEEFRDLAEFFHRPQQKRYGCSLLTGRGYDSIVMGFQPFLWAWGGAWGDPQTYEVQGHLNTEGAVAGLEFFKSLLQFAPEGGTNADYFFNLEAFSNGSTAMVLDYFPFYPGLVASMGDQVGFFRFRATRTSASSRWAGRALAFRLRPRRKSKNGPSSSSLGFPRPPSRRSG